MYPPLGSTSHVPPFWQGFELQAPTPGEGSWGAATGAVVVDGTGAGVVAGSGEGLVGGDVVSTGDDVGRVGEGVEGTGWGEVVEEGKGGVVVADGAIVGVGAGRSVVEGAGVATSSNCWHSSAVLDGGWTSTSASSASP